MLAPRLIALGCLLAVACDAPPTEPPPAWDSTGSTSGADAEAGSDGAPGDDTGGGSTSGNAESGSADDDSDTEPQGTFGPGDHFPEYCPAGVEPSMEMGLGDIEYRPLGDEVAQLVMGHQGGYHVVIGLRGYGLDLYDWGSGHLQATIGGVVVADYETIIVMTCDEDGGEYSEALWVNLIFDAEPDDIVGRTTEAEVQFTDASGVTVVASGSIQISEDIVHQ